MDKLSTGSYIDEIIGLNYLYLTRSNEPRQRGTTMNDRYNHSEEEVYEYISGYYSVDEDLAAGKEVA